MAEGFERAVALIEELVRRNGTGGKESIEDLFTEDAHYEGAFADIYFHGAKAIAAMHGKAASQIFNPFTFRIEGIYPVVGGDQIALETVSEGISVHSGARYTNKYASFFKLRDGRIAYWREYYNPQAFMAAVGPDVGEIISKTIPEGGIRSI